MMDKESRLLEPQRVAEIIDEVGHIEWLRDRERVSRLCAILNNEQDAKCVKAMIDYLKKFETPSYVENHGEHIYQGQGITMLPDQWQALKRSIDEK